MADTHFGVKSIGERDWKPHNCNIETDSSTHFTSERAPGPDWSSSIRCLPTDCYQPNNYSNQTNCIKTAKRNFPWKREESMKEYQFYPDGSEFGKKCVIQGEVLANIQTVNEIKLEKVIGTKTKVSDSRGGLPYSAPGDKSYSIPEFSSKFHKDGSTLPTVYFSNKHDVEVDTFIPLQTLPRQASQTYKEKITYKEKEEGRKLFEERDNVEKLDDWLPSPPLTAKSLMIGSLPQH